MISKIYGCRSCGDMAPVFTYESLDGSCGITVGEKQLTFMHQNVCGSRHICFL